MIDELMFLESRVERLEQENEEQKEALRECVEFIDSILPQAGELTFDIGLLNSALIKARPFIKE